MRYKPTERVFSFKVTAYDSVECVRNCFVSHNLQARSSVHRARRVYFQQMLRYLKNVERKKLFVQTDQMISEM